jgi:hypothetical protein
MSCAGEIRCRGCRGLLEGRGGMALRHKDRNYVEYSDGDVAILMQTIDE